MKMVRWWAVVLVGAAAVLLFAWLGRAAGVPLSTLLTVGAALAALMWTVVLVTWPWNLFFDARQVVADNATSRERGIAVPAGHDVEAGRIARRMLWFALGGHVGTAAVTAFFAYVNGALTGYYIAGFYLLSTAVRPAAAYFAHLRERVTSLRRESTHPRDDVATLTSTATSLAARVQKIEHQQVRVQEENLERLRRLENAQATDRAAARDGDAQLRARVDRMTHRIEATLDGISDHQELMTGMRALIRLIRAEA